MLLSLLAATLAAAIRATPAPAADGPLRLVDTYRAPSEDGRIINGVYKRILPGAYGRQVFSLQGAPEKPRLRFSIGLFLEAEQRAKVRFDIVLRRKGSPRRILYSRDLDTTTWVDEEIDLSAHDLGGADLLMRKAMVEGPPAVLYQADWGEPMLIPGTPKAATSVILISLDTLRADHVGVYGNNNVRTPTLDALARSGVWYSNSYSASTWTYPSHAALLYGLYPSSLPSLDPSPAATQGATPPRPLNVAEAFRSGGYITAAFTGGGYMSDRWGFTRGFDTYYMFPQPAQTKDCSQDRFDGPPVFDRAERWLRENATRPFFLFVHTYEVHDRCPIWPAGLGPYASWTDPGPPGRKKVIDYYDSLVRRADSLVAGIVHEIESLGLSERVVIAVTGDHGEAFWEHGYYGHGCVYRPYEPLVRVPLIVRPAGKPERRGAIQPPVSAVDVAPTLLTLAGLPPPSTMQGYVLPGLGSEGRPQSAPVFVQCEDKIAVRVGRHKFIASGKSAAREELYDLEKDPGEKTNLITQAADEVALLRGLAREYWQSGSVEAGTQKRQVDDLDEQTRERLRALGYLE